jgi:hypothetical protein
MLRDEVLELQELNKKIKKADLSAFFAFENM